MPIRTEPVMGTLVTVHVVTDCAPEVLDRAFGWFFEIEARCTRFDPESELMRLCSRTEEAVPVSPVLFEAISFAIRVAEESNGAFDPTVGASVASRGFDREHRSGDILVLPRPNGRRATFRDVHLDFEQKTVTLSQPLTLDLGAVAKGLAIDMAARELADCRDFAIDAGGDLYFAGRNPKGEEWIAGIRHPRTDDLIESLHVSNQAVCTSGDYERRGHNGDAHIVDPRRASSGEPGVASVTVVAPNAMLADALSTAAFVLGPVEGLAFLQRQGVDGFMVTTSLERHYTMGMPRAA